MHWLSGIRPLHQWLQVPSTGPVRRAPHRAVAEADLVDLGDGPDLDARDGPIGYGVCTVGPSVPASVSERAVCRDWGKSNNMDYSWTVGPFSFHCR